MTLIQIIVTVTGLALSIFVIWFFLFSKKKARPATQSNQGIQEAFITVKGGYDPDVIVVKQGKPVRLNFLRQETDDCSERVIFSDFNKSAILTPFQTIPVEFTPDKKGEFEFTCGMGMLQGKLIVE
jgi:plastocyanin domain-containing protein